LVEILLDSFVKREIQARAKKKDEKFILVGVTSGMSCGMRVAAVGVSP
jgi:predicted secreted protein